MKVRVIFFFNQPDNQLTNQTISWRTQHLILSYIYLERKSWVKVRLNEWQQTVDDRLEKEKCILFEVILCHHKKTCNFLSFLFNAVVFFLVYFLFWIFHMDCRQTCKLVVNVHFSANALIIYCPHWLRL